MSPVRSRPTPQNRQRYESKLPVFYFAKLHQLRQVYLGTSTAFLIYPIPNLATIILYLILSSDKVFCLLLENGKGTHFNAYLNLRSTMLYIPITTIALSVLVSPINFVLLTVLVILQFIGKVFVKVVGGQEEKFRLKAKYNINSGGDDNK